MIKQLPTVWETWVRSLGQEDLQEKGMATHSGIVAHPHPPSKKGAQWNILASLVAQTIKRLPAMQETQVRSLGREDPWRRKWQPTPVSLPGGAW